LTFTDDDIVPENFETMNSVAALIARKQLHA
jgi:hypothetical protein